MVGTTNTQTLTNKTLTTPTLTTAVVATSLDMNGTKLILDPDADTSITADTDNQIDIEIAGADDFRFTANTFTALSGSTIATNTIAETTGGSGVTIDGLNIKDNKLNTNNSIITANITDAAVTFAKTSGIWWEELATVTLGSSGDVITVSGFTARKFLHILMFLNPSGGNVDGNITFNNDTGNNYARRIEVNGANDVIGVSQAQIAAFASSAEDAFGSYEILNVATEEKILSGIGATRGTTGAGNAPNKRVLIGKWANTSDSIVRVDVTNTEAGSYGAGSQVIVLGHD